MLFNNLMDDNLKEYFKKMLSDGLNSDIRCRKIDINGETKAYVFSSNSSILSVYRDREELFIPHNKENESIVLNSIDSFNKICIRDSKIEYIIS